MDIYKWNHTSNILMGNNPEESMLECGFFPLSALPHMGKLFLSNKKKRTTTTKIKLSQMEILYLNLLI